MSPQYPLPTPITRPTLSQAIDHTEGDAKTEDPEAVANGVGSDANQDLESAREESGRLDSEFCRHSQQVEAKILKMRVEDVSKRDRRQAIDERENRPMPAHLRDECTAIAKGSGVKAREGLRAPQCNQVGKGHRLAPKWIDEECRQPDAQDARLPSNVKVAFNRRAIARP